MEMKAMSKIWSALRCLVPAVAFSLGVSLLTSVTAHAQDVCSVWLIESSRFMKVPFGAFMPDRAFVPGSAN